MRPVVYVATNHDWHGYQHFYQGLAQAFAASRSVLYVGSVRSGSATTLQQVSERIWLLNTLVPKGAGRRVLRPVRDRLLAKSVRQSLHELGWTESPIVWTYTTDATPLLRSCRAAASVYWTGDEVVDPLERSLLRVVDHVFTVSPAATDQKQRLTDRARVTEMPMAIDPSPYEAAARAAEVPADLADLPRPLFGYGGAVNARTDWELVRELAARTKGTVLIVGPSNDAEGAAQMTRDDNPPNLVFLGHRSASEAPAYLAALDVGLIPYRLSKFNIGSNPVKTYDYLAAGVRVVATDIPAIRPLQPHVQIATDRADFVDLALRAAASPPTTAERGARQSVARSYSYDALVERVDEVLGDAAHLP